VQPSLPALNIWCAAQVRSVRERNTRHQLSALYRYPYRRRIGVMGGSFNPAHSGHLYISDEARKSARLDEIWWLVSPQNPLKSKTDMADFQTRLAAARKLAGRFGWLRCLDIEQQRGLSFTFETIAFLRRFCPCAKLVWIMGADNLIQFPQWNRARQIASSIPILIMNRPGYGWQGLSAKGAAILGRGRRVKNATLLSQKNRGWAYFHHSRNMLSGTALRQLQPRPLAETEKNR